MRVWYVWLLSTVVALAFLVIPPTWAGEHKGHVMIMPASLQWMDVPSLPAGAKIAVIEGPITEAAPFTFRLKLPANFKIPPHWHPATERITVLSGTFHLGTGDTFDRAKMNALPAGSISITGIGTPPRNCQTRSPSPPDSKNFFGADLAASAAPNPMPIRADRFSHCRAGFDVRTLRLCRSVLMIHHFAELGALESVALPGETYKLAFTPGLLTQVYGKRVTDAMLATDGGYVQREGEATWWIPSGGSFTHHR